MIQWLLQKLAMDKNKHAKVIAQHLARVFLYDEQIGSKKLYPDVREKYYKLWDIMREKRMQIKLVETFRSVPRQNSLSRGVTNAKGLQSYHQYGLAFDVYFLYKGWDAPADWWQALGEEGEKLGLIWGGRWKSKDYGHFEWHPNFTWEDLKPYLEVVD
ncbi:hypothetical protein LCGC14_1331050 [marine sediment metagenome]|uniref:Peptidase M15C domain-containing protein n=1 Tax=marine sediment metagenome TaxID=412755 RepID=A0A0F9L2N0_9ZZZZ